MITKIIQTIAKWFEPRFKVGDVIYDSSSEFPDKETIKVILAVGKREYQWQFLKIDGIQIQHGSPSASSIEYVDMNYSKIGDQL